jgi:hypothetical protein
MFRCFHMSRSSAVKRRLLRKRLIWVFQRDDIEGQLDCLVRVALGKERRFFHD